MPDLILKIAANYVFIQVSIILFALPFYLWFRHAHRSEGLTKRNFNHHLEQFFLSKQVNYLIFFWAMSEAVVWFVIPEFLLLLLIFMRIRRKKELLVYDVGGTIVGTCLAFVIHPSYQFVTHLPYIQDKMITQTAEWYHQLGVWGLIYQPFSGVPYKVFTLTSQNYDFFLPYFLIVAVLVRMSRYVIVFGLFLAIYPGLRKYVRRDYVRLALIATFIFSLLLLKVSNSFS